MTWERRPAGRGIHADEIVAMLDPGAGDEPPGPLDVRDTAIIAWLWPADGRRAEAAVQRLSPRAIGLVVGRRRRAAHLGPLSTHDWRRTFVGGLLDSGARLLAALVASARRRSIPHPPWTPSQNGEDRSSWPGSGRVSS